MAYWDTSCLLKLYAPESDSDVFRARALQGDSVITSDITRFELFAALSRKESAGDLYAGGARQALAAYDADVQAAAIVVVVTATSNSQFENVIDRCYRRMPVVPLRTLDAIHLAAAVSAGETELVTTDTRLRDAASALGLQVFPLP